MHCLEEQAHTHNKNGVKQQKAQSWQEDEPWSSFFPLKRLGLARTVHTVYDPKLGSVPAQNIVYTSYIYRVGQPYKSGLDFWDRLLRTAASVALSLPAPPCQPQQKKVATAAAATSESSDFQVKPQRNSYQKWCNLPYQKWKVICVRVPDNDGECVVTVSPHNGRKKSEGKWRSLEQKEIFGFFYQNSNRGLLEGQVVCTTCELRKAFIPWLF